ncbi:hypothetical protein F4780DRAFT_461207 [Xylariomycetidae sp. FL0641]|nr:hypothetical protein F4780DRAFT_461207 [Xylariomycetidae sp. FL0641]
MTHASLPTLPERARASSGSRGNGQHTHTHTLPALRESHVTVTRPHSGTRRLADAAKTYTRYCRLDGLGPDPPPPPPPPTTLLSPPSPRALGRHSPPEQVPCPNGCHAACPARSVRSNHRRPRDSPDLPRLVPNRRPLAAPARLDGIATTVARVGRQVSRRLPRRRRRRRATPLPPPPPADATSARVDVTSGEYVRPRARLSFTPRLDSRVTTTTTTLHADGAPSSSSSAYSWECGRGDAPAPYYASIWQPFVGSSSDALPSRRGGGGRPAPLRITCQMRGSSRKDIDREMPPQPSQPPGCWSVSALSLACMRLPCHVCFDAL